MSNTNKGLRAIFVRECKRLVSRPVYLICIIGVPLFCAFFFTTLMWQGVPNDLPVAVVDLDKSKSSRNLIRTLESMSFVDVDYKLNSYHEAREAMQRNEIYAFLMIPEGFQEKASSGKQPELSYFTNDAYFVAGGFTYKALKMTAALANGSVIRQTMIAKGVPQREMDAKLQPVILDTNPIGNPWVNYSVFLNNIMLPVMIELMILLMTVFTIGVEIKAGTSRRLLIEGNRSLLRVLLGKLLPQTILFTLVGWGINIYLFGFLHFPHANGALPVMLAMFMMVVSTQALGVFFIGCFPVLRLGLSSASLFGIVGFSLTGFSFPVMAMYKPFQVLANFYPVRHYFSIYTQQALNGSPIWYSLYQYLTFVLYLVLPLLIAGRLRKALYDQKYKP